jgi:hypothetical protein
MRTIWVIFVLALITVAGEIYADAVITTSLVAPAASDPAPVGDGHIANPGQIAVDERKPPPLGLALGARGRLFSRFFEMALSRLNGCDGTL